MASAPAAGAPRPFRVLAAATLADTTGNGLFLTVGVLFLTRKVHIPAYQVGLGLSVAAALGVAAGIQIGAVADRRGHRRLLVGLNLLQGLIVAAYPFVGGFWTFLVVACAETMCDRGASTARGAVLATAFPPDRRVAIRARMRVLTNLGISLGALGGGVVLRFDTRIAYQAALLADAATFLVTGALLLGLPQLAGRTPVPGESRLPALRDRPFLAVTAICGVLSLEYGLIETGIPLWIANRTHAPRLMVSGVLLVNTVMCVALQVRASRGTGALGHAARAQTLAGLLLAGGCLLFAAGHGRGPVVASVVLVCAAVVLTGGELLAAAGGWGLAYGLAPAERQGVYQGVFGAGAGVAQTIGPVVATTLAVTWGPPGWLLLAALFAGAGLAARPVAAWAVRTRPRYGVALPTAAG